MPANESRPVSRTSTPAREFRSTSSRTPLTRVVVTETAARSLAELIDSHSLPGDTSARVRRTLAPLERFPHFGPALDPATPEVRFLLGPWRWLIIVYAYRESDDIVAVLAFEDGRSAHSATGRRRR